MEPDVPSPEFFVARDRAMRLARYIREALQERRLHYRGADVGMTTLTEEADEAMAAVVADARETVAALLGQRLRDRERAYMEIPLVTVAERVAETVELARRLDRARGQGSVPERDGRAAVLALLEDALLRLEAFAGAYDAKRPAGPARASDVAHVLATVERQAAWERLAMRVAEETGGPPWDRAPPPIASDPHALEDLLRAARAAVPAARGPWRVERARPGRPLTLALGTARSEAVEVPPPERLVRAAQVLSFLHPVSATCRGAPAERTGGLLSPADAAAAVHVDEVRIALADEAAGRLELTVAAAAGDQARLDPAAERAVRSLMQSPPLPEAGPPPPQRLVAIMGLVRALDVALRDRVLPRARTNAVRVAASRLPRETTRKAPLRAPVVAALEGLDPALTRPRLEAVAADVAGGRLAARHANARDVAILIALFGRDWHAAGSAMSRVLGLDPLTPDEVVDLVADLLAIAAVREDLERGASVEPARITRLERAAVATLGRLGRLD